MSVSEGSCTPNAELRDGIEAALMKSSARVDGLLENESFKRNYCHGALSTLANGSSIGSAERNSRTKTGFPSFSDDLINYQSAGLLKRSFVENLFFGDFGGKVGDVDIQSIWRDLVTHYSSRNLTVDADKVRAISGITEALRRRFALKNFHYELWINSLCEEFM